VLTLLLSFSSLKYELAVTIPSSDSEAAGLVLGACLILVSTCLTCLVIVIGLDISSVNLLAGISNKYLYMIPIGLFGAGLYQLMTYWQIRKHGFFLIGKTRLVQSLSMVGCQVGMGFLTGGAMGLLVGDTVGRSAGGLQMAKGFFLQNKTDYRQNWRRIYIVLRRYVDFPKFSTWSTFASSLGMQMPNIIIASLFSPAAAGFYLLASRIGGLPSDILGQAVGQAYMAEVSESIRSGRLSDVIDITKSTMNKMIIWGFVIISGCLVLANFIEMIFGSEWVMTKKYLVILSPVFALKVIVSPVSNIIYLSQRQVIQAVGDFVRVALIAACFFVTLLISGTALQAVTAYSIIMSLFYISWGYIYIRTAYSLGDK